MEGKASRLLVLGILAAALVSSMFGCGGSDGSKTSADVSKTQFLKEGNKICEERLEEKNAAVKSALEESGAAEGRQPTNQIKKELGESIASTFAALTTEFSELSPPAEDKKQVEDITAELRAALTKAEANPVHLLLSDPFLGVAEAARSFGLTSCNL